MSGVEAFSSYKEVNKALEISYSKNPSAWYAHSEIDGGNNFLAIGLKEERKPNTQLILFLTIDAMLGVEKMVEMVKGDRGEGEIKINILDIPLYYDHDVFSASTDRKVIKDLLSKLEKRREDQVEKIKAKGKGASDHRREKITQIRGEHILSFITDSEFKEFISKIKMPIPLPIDA